VTRPQPDRDAERDALCGMMIGMGLGAGGLLQAARARLVF
jgi:hypothetical protein